MTTRRRLFRTCSTPYSCCSSDSKRVSVIELEYVLRDPLPLGPDRERQQQEGETEDPRHFFFLFLTGPKWQ